MSVRVIGADELRRSLTFNDLIEPMERAFQLSSAGYAASGIIGMFPLPDRSHGDAVVKTGTLTDSPIYIVKIAPWFAVNVEKGEPQGGFLAVFDSFTGHTLAILDDRHYLSDIRTAAAGALAARLFAPTDVAVAGVLGSGVQAYWQALALYRERPFPTMRIWARDEAKADGLAQRLSLELPEAAITVHADVEYVVRSSDVLITATQSTEPLVRGAWLHSGQHVTAVGADDPNKCELDADALNMASVFVDDIETTITNGDVHRAISQGHYAAAHLRGEIGDVLAERVPGRASAGDITIAKFVGIGAQDLLAAVTALEKCGILIDV